MRAFCFLTSLLLCAGILRAQSVSDSLSAFEQYLATAAFSQALDVYPVIQDHPDKEATLARLSTYFSAQAISQFGALDSSQVQAVLAIQQAIIDQEYTRSVYWNRQRGLTLLLLREQVGPSLLPVWEESLREARRDMPFMIWEQYAQTLMDSLKANPPPLDSVLKQYQTLDAYLMNITFLEPAHQEAAQHLCSRLDRAISQLLPPCESLVQQYLQRMDRGLLGAFDYEQLYVITSLLECPSDAFRDSISQSLARLTADPYLLRRLALDASANYQYESAIRWMEKSAAGESDLALYARDLLMLADLHMRRENFRTARVYALRADKAHPTWGEPFLFLAELSLKSAVFCRFTDFERKALYWLAMDYCELAAGRNPDLGPRVQSLMADYRRNMPEPEACRFYGLEAGDTFPIRCWMETTTTVRY